MNDATGAGTASGGAAIVTGGRLVAVEMNSDWSPCSRRLISQALGSTDSRTTT
jgi:hypothetical protein